LVDTHSSRFQFPIEKVGSGGAGARQAGTGLLGTRCDPARVAGLTAPRPLTSVMIMKRSIAAARRSMAGVGGKPGATSKAAFRALSLNPISNTVPPH